MITNENFARARVSLKRSAAAAAAFILFGCVIALALSLIVPGTAALFLLGAVAWILLGLTGAVASVAFFATQDASAANAAAGRLERRIDDLEKQLAERKAGLNAIANQYTTLRTDLSEQVKIDSRRTEARLETLGDEIRKLGHSIEAVAAEQRRTRRAAGAARLGDEDRTQRADQASGA